MPLKTESRTTPDRIPLHNALHPSKEMTSNGLLTSQTDGGLPDPVIIHGYPCKAPIILGCLVVRVDKRLTDWFSALLSAEYPGSNLAIIGATVPLSVTEVTLGMREADLTCSRSLKNSNGELMSDSAKPATMPAIKASETWTKLSSRPSAKKKYILSEAIHGMFSKKRFEQYIIYKIPNLENYSKLLRIYTNKILKQQII